MEDRYKIILNGRNLYKEIELTPDAKEVKVGTGVDCDVRLYKELFFGTVELDFVKNEQSWSVTCSDNLYLSLGDIRKLMTKELEHGDEFVVKYQQSGNDVFSVSFMIDFDNGKRKYDRAIDISKCTSLLIGKDTSCDIELGSKYVVNDVIKLERHNNEYILSVVKSTYGVNVNGNRIDKDIVIKDYDFFSIADYVFYVKNKTLWTEIRDDILVKSLSYFDSKVPNEYPLFIRNTRIKTVVNDEKIELLDPPSKPQEPRNNILTRLLPALGMLVGAGVMAMMGGVTMLIFSGVSAAMGVITSIIGIKQAKKDFKKTSEERIEKYNTYISNKRTEVETDRNAEKETLEDIYVSQDKLLNRLDNFSSDLFDRSPEDDDFLCIRFGNGNVESKRQLNYKKQEKLEFEDDLQTIPEEMYNEYKYISDAPVTCDLKAVNAIGIAGKESLRFEFLKNMVFDIAARQYYSDVKLFFIADKKNADKVRWLRLLPHVYSDAIKNRTVAYNDESKNLLFEYLYKELTSREQNKIKAPHIVVFFYDEYGFNNHPISKFVDKAKDLGVTFVFFNQSKAELPQGCSYVVEIADEKSATLIDTSDKNKSTAFTYPHLSNSQAISIVNLLAPIYTEEISLEGALTKSISMFEMLNILAVDDLDLNQRWAQSQVFKSMAAPIGVTKSGIVNLDLHDKAHGPHGLVAGTTGSGKSEVLQTYVLSMATLFSPYEVSFVIIDFKGGGMANQFKELPHMLGAITNIDGKEISRSLKSIKAELQKRQRLFAEADVNHIDKYIRKFKAGEVKIPLPHLIIIVDEFAELKAEQPDFMKELISAARIGRSLGVHLILATQKPSGQVDEQIWSNSRFKLCLKVQSQQDSNEVLKSPLAAEIKEPGRAYLQVGNNEIFELFQSAYSGAPEKTDDSNMHEYDVYELADTGRRIPVYSQKKSKTNNSKTQLEALVNYIADYCSQKHISKLPNICLPSLKETIDFTMDQRKANTFAYIADIGVYDDPDNQYQGVYSIDVGSENTMIIGSSQTGKTNLLQCIIRNLAGKYSPTEVSIYILDFASLILKNFDSLNHVGGVVTPSEDEKLKNLFKMLHEEVERRKNKLMSVGVSSFTAYKEAGNTDLPQIVLIIDNLTALKEMYLQDDDALLDLCRDGLSIGISVIISNSQTAGIGYKYLSNFSNRIAMFCNDSGEYNSLFDHCNERISNIAGRCLIKLDNANLECQTYLAFKGDKEIDRVKTIKEFIAEVNKNYSSLSAKKIPVIPESLTSRNLIENYKSQMVTRYNTVAGIDYGTVSPLTINFGTVGCIAVTGREKSGKHNWIHCSIELLNQMYPGSLKLYIVDGFNRRFSDLKDANYCQYSTRAEDALKYIKEIDHILLNRYTAISDGNINLLNESELLMLIIENPDAVTAISNDTNAFNSYKEIVGRFKGLNACVIVSAIENEQISYSSPEVLKLIRDQHQMLFFDDISNMKVFDMPLSITRMFKKQIEIGDCYYIKDNECRKLKTAFNITKGE